MEPRRAWLVLPALMLVPAEAPAVDLCVTTATDRDDAAAFEKLVMSELARHPSHTVVAGGCASHLEVELFELEGVLFLTARIDLEVPVRYGIQDEDDIERRLAEGLALVLGNDPAYLMQDITRYGALQRATHSVLVKGLNVYRLEVFQAIGRSDLAPVFAPGAAFAFTRGSEHWYVLARAYFAGWPGTISHDERALRIHAGLDVGIVYEVGALAPVTFYAGAGLGLQFVRFDGTVDSGDEPLLDHVNRFGVTASARAGLRFLRFCDFDVDVFAEGYLPLFLTKQTDALLFGERGVYTPAIQLGVGVGF
jgi:hypothetical protein